MKYHLLLFTFVFSSVAVAAQKSNIPLIKLPQLLSMVSHPSDTLYVVNYWATWCRPCVAELPVFEQLSEMNANKKLKILFVSLDSPKKIGKVEAMKKEKNLKSDMLLLNETDPNRWINSVDSTWSGAIPATCFYLKQKKLLFYEGELSFTKLDSLTQNYIQ